MAGEAVALAAAVGLVSGSPATLAVVAAVGIGLLAALTLWLVPRHQTTRWRREGIEGKELAELVNGSRATLTQALGGLALVATLALTAYQVNETRKTSERNIRVTEEGQATQLLSHAVDQLGATVAGRPSLDTRVGALYSLERLAVDAPDRASFIGAILTAYVRDNLPRAATGVASHPPCAPRSRQKPRQDVRVALASLAEVARAGNAAAAAPASLTFALDGLSFAGLDLTDVTFAGLDLERVSFRDADLAHARFGNDLYGRTDFRGACLRGAQFHGMSGLDVAWHLDLRGADVRAARFQDLESWDPAFYIGNDYSLREFRRWDSSGWAVIRTDAATRW